MSEILIPLISIISGFVIGIFYDRLKLRRKQSNIKNLIRKEISKNVAALSELLSLLKSYMTKDRPKFIAPISIEEISARIENSCNNDTFKSFLQDIASMTPKEIETIYDFYYGLEEVPKTFRDIERFAGNIRHGLFEDYIGALIQKGNKALQLLRTKKSLPEPSKQIDKC